MQAYRTGVQLIYESADITKDITDYLLDFSYTDDNDEADDLQITLENRERLWYQDWYPSRGDKFKPTILITDEQGQTKKLPTGEYEVDELNITGPPNVATIKGVSALVSDEFKNTKRSQSWEKAEFKLIVDEISKKYGYKVIYNILKEKEFDKIDQNQMSDLEFLHKLCNDLNYGLKIEAKQIVITEEAYYEKHNPDFTIYYEDMQNKPQDNIKNNGFELLSYDMSQTSFSSYSAAELSYKDPKSGKTYHAKVGNKAEKVTKKILRLNKKVKSNKEAEEICKKALEKANVKTNPAKFTIAPRFPIYSKMLIGVNGFGKFDGKYLVDKVSHNLSTSGYTVDIECRKYIKGIRLQKSDSKEDQDKKGTSGIPEANGKGVEAMLSYAKSNLGKRYSQKDRMSANAFDCSSLASRSLAAGGFCPPGKAWSTRTFHTCPYISEVPISEIKPGDILNSYNSHAMVYLGNGQVIEAQPKKGVVIGRLRTKGYKAYRPKGA